MRCRRPSARWEPIERRRTRCLTVRGSRLLASACRCRPAARPTIAISVPSGTSATWPIRISPRACSRAAVLGPTPQIRSTGSGCRNAISSPAGTTSSPSGLAVWLAILARCLVVATPTVIGSPTSSRTRARSVSAICRGVPAKCSIPRTSRNASSIEIPSTTGDMSSNTANTSLLACE